MSTLTAPHPPAPRADQPAGPALWRTVLNVAEARWAVAATVLFALGAIVQFAGGPEWVYWALYLSCYATGGWEPALAGLQALKERTLDVDILMIVAAIAAAAIGQIFDGALLIVIFATSGSLEAIATRRTQDSVRALLDLAPERATRLVDGREEEVETRELAGGDIVLVRPGERVGADGTVIDGASDVDQATITGEPLPVAKVIGDEVFAGTLNGGGALTIRVDRAASESVVARIVALVEEASETKATTQLFIEKVEQRYSIGVVVATILLMGVPLVLGAAFEPTLLRAMTFMIVASPCAVVLATMPPLLAAMANAGRHGVLVKSAVVLEQLSTIDTVAFDKTGTLTVGAPRVSDIVPAGGLDASVSSEEELLRIAAAAEVGSEHPVGRAIVAAAKARSLTLDRAEEFRAEPGRGVVARIGGRRVEVGSPRLVEDAGSDPQGAHVPLVKTLGELEASGRTAVVVLIDGRPAGVIALADSIRGDAPSAVAGLAELTGNSPLMLTGDNQRAADAIAREVGITEAHGDQLPDDKAATVRRLVDEGRRVALVGDGINDAPALASAHVGVAMGRDGSDLALETADAVLVSDDLKALGRTIALSKRAERVVRANLVFAFTVIVVLVSWDIAFTLPLPLGVAGHEGSTIVVALNGLRLLRRRAWDTAA